MNSLTALTNSGSFCNSCTTVQTSSSGLSLLTIFVCFMEAGVASIVFKPFAQGVLSD